jgi:hypothetical protein
MWGFFLVFDWWFPLLLLVRNFTKSSQSNTKKRSDGRVMEMLLKAALLSFQAGNAHVHNEIILFQKYKLNTEKIFCFTSSFI